MELRTRCRKSNWTLVDKRGSGRVRQMTELRSEWPIWTTGNNVNEACGWPNWANDSTDRRNESSPNSAIDNTVIRTCDWQNWTSNSTEKRGECKPNLELHDKIYKACDWPNWTKKCTDKGEECRPNWTYRGTDEQSETTLTRAMTISATKRMIYQVAQLSIAPLERVLTKLDEWRKGQWSRTLTN